MSFENVSTGARGEPAEDGQRRLSEMERALRETQAQGQHTHQLLQTLLDRLEKKTTPSKPTFVREPGTETPPVAPPPTHTHPRPHAAPPNDFNGDRNTGRAFLTSCEVYLTLSGTLFPDDKARILWTLSYMKMDRAATFAKRIMQLQYTDSPLWQSWQV